MGLVLGPHAVLGMIERATAATGATFSLRVVETLTTTSNCSPLIAWLARGGLIATALVLPENPADHRAARGEA
jgi:hypothetical protein